MSLLLSITRLLSSIICLNSYYIVICIYMWPLLRNVVFALLKVWYVVIVYCVYFIYHSFILTFIIWLYLDLLYCIIPEYGPIYYVFSILMFRQIVKTPLKYGYRNYHKSDDQTDFAFWLAGFICADGCLFNSGDDAGIIIRQKDPQVLHYIVNKLGFGKVFISGDGYYSINFGKKQHIGIILNMIYDKIYLLKTHTRLITLINRYNLMLNIEKQIPLLPFVQNPAVLETAWLTGFSDGDASFRLRLAKETGRAVRLRFNWLLTQANSNCFLLHLKSILTGAISPVTTRGKIAAYRIEVSNMQSIESLIKYFTRFPPITAKFRYRFLCTKKVFKHYDYLRHHPDVIERIKARMESSHTGIGNVPGLYLYLKSRSL